MWKARWALAVLALAWASASAQEAAPVEPDWAALRALEAERSWTAVESLAVVFVRQLESAAVADSSAIARALLYRANAAWERRRHGEPGVVEALQRSIALQRRHDPPGGLRLPWSHLLAARVLHDLAQAQLALDHARTAARLFAAADRPDTILWADAELYVGSSAASLARPREARAGYDRSLQLREAKYGARSSNLVPPLAEYAMMLTEQGEFEDARALLIRAEKLSQSIENPFNNFLMETLARRSTLEARAGHLAESIEFAERASAGLLERWGPQSLEFARARVRLAYRLEEFGDHAGEARILQEAVPVLDGALGSEHPHTVNARVAWLGASLELGDTATVARELPVVRRALAAEAGTVNRNAFYGLMLESQLAELRGDARAARARVLEALELPVLRDDASGRSRAVATGMLLRTCSGTQDRAMVEELGNDLDELAARTSVAGTKEWIEVLDLRAQAEARTGMLDRAWRSACVAESEALDWFRYEVQALPDARALQLSSRIGESTDLLVALATPADPERVTEAWDRLVRWRGLVAQEMARRRPAASSTGDATVVLAHARWIDAQRRLARQVVSGSMHPTDRGAIAALDSAKVLAEAAERQYMRAARDVIQAPAVVSLEALRARLNGDQALVGFARGEGGTGQPTLNAFVACGPTAPPLLLRLGTLSELTPPILAWRRALVRVLENDSFDAHELESRRLGAAVRDRIWDPIAAVLGTAREILLVPEGPVAELPWLALPIDDDRYLAESSFTVRVLNAERELLHATQDDPGSGGLLAIGGPDFEAASEVPLENEPITIAMRSSATPCFAAADVTLGDLPAARREAEQIAAVWSANERSGSTVLLVGARANECDFKALVPGRSVLHLATHGVVIEDGCAHATTAADTRGVGGIAALASPSTERAIEKTAAVSPWLGRRVWLALAGANHARAHQVDENDGMLTAEEIITLDLRSARWVVLSACDSGIGDAWTREGLLGLRRAFHLAGARAVIASQWPVADESTREWMDALYRARARVHSAGAAVQEACREVLVARRASGRSTDPFHWAAFVATGE